jgi:hypothetical protein
MFQIDGGRNIRRIKRRPRNWEKLESWDYHFIPEHGFWDTTACDLISIAIGLYDISPAAGVPSNERWLKRRAREFCRTGHLNLTADPC